MSLSSDLRRWAVFEWRSWRWWVTLAVVLGVILALTPGDPRAAIAPLLFIVGAWIFWLVFRFTAFLFLGIPLLGVLHARRPWWKARQLKRDVEREMRRPPFEQL